MSELIISQERFLDVWPEEKGIATDHYLEVNAGERKNHPYIMNTELIDLIEKAGAFKVYVARIDGKLVGYCSWSISPDVESMGVILADQGPWYVVPWAQSIPGFKNTNIALRLLRYCIRELKILGVHSVQLHHQLNGRGANAGVMFKRLGAKPLQHRYALWIGD